MTKISRTQVLATYSLEQAHEQLRDALTAAKAAAANLTAAVEDAELLRTSRAIYDAQQAIAPLSAALRAAKIAEAIYAGIKARQ